VLGTWLPLAASWLLMGLELPLVSAVMARLPQATVSLAAYGGVVFPCALLIESPIIMLLAASTAVSRDRQAYQLVQRFMYVTGGLLTALHAIMAFTPLFDFVAGTVLRVPPETREPARLGLRLMVPWTLSIAYRRTQQGVLIRFRRPRAVTIGTAVRLGTNAAVLALGAWHGRLPGIAVGAGAVACGVVAEALYAGWAVRPVRKRLMPAVGTGPPLTLGAFLHFYVPLSATPLIGFLAMPLSAGGMARMPLALESLAIWPVLSGVAFTLRSLGFAFNEVVVSQLDHRLPVPALRRFALWLSALTSGALLAAAATPLGALWFGRASALAPDLTKLAARALWIMVPLPALAVWQSWWQGALVHSRRTRGVTESVIALLSATFLVLVAGVAHGNAPGVFFAAAGFTIGNTVQTAWLAWRARGEIAHVEARDSRPRSIG
jgi:progressive ankylosis protein